MMSSVLLFLCLIFNFNLQLRLIKKTFLILSYFIYIYTFFFTGQAQIAVF